MDIREEKSSEAEIDGSNSPIQPSISGHDTLGRRIKQLEDSVRDTEGKVSEASREINQNRIENLEADKNNKSEFLQKSMESIGSLKDSLSKAVKCLNTIDEGGKSRIENDEDEDDTAEMELKKERNTVMEEIIKARKLAEIVESKIKEYTEAKKKEKKELESSLVSLTEENRDINSLLRVALAEKDALEKKMKGNNEQKKAVLMQMAERGLQRVGFGFMVGSGSQEMVIEGSGTGSSKSDCGTDTEEETVSLASTVEKMMKNLRGEISKLRRSLEESRSDKERLQSVAEEQLQEIKESRYQIKELEARERALAQNVDQLLIEIKEANEEAGRWREACELEVKAGRLEIAERDTLINIFKLELERAKAALEMSNGKLKLKEDLVKMAMVAHEAAERSLKLADSRATGLRNRIEKLTKQLEELETRERNRRKARRFCWPWQAFKAAKHVNSRRGLVLRDTQALLQRST